MTWNSKKNWKKLKHSPNGYWINEFWYRHWMKYYTAVKINIPQQYPSTWWTGQTQKAAEGHMQNDIIYIKFKNMQN